MFSKHQADNRLDEQRRPDRAAFAALRPAFATPGVLVLFLALVPGRGGVGPVEAAGAALPDSVVARLPFKDISKFDMMYAWYRLEARYRPAGKGLELRRAFLDQIVEKEVLARAALAEPFVYTRQESARYASYKDDLLRQALYRQLVLDSLTVTDEDKRLGWEDLKGSGMSDSVSARQAARARAERRRSEVVMAQMKTDLAPVWDDSVAALMARGYGALPPTQEKTAAGIKLRMSNRLPEFPPADTGRVLVKTTGDRITVADFGRRFLLLSPMERTYPSTPGEVKARAEQFLGSAWFLAEATRRGLQKTPLVAQALAERHESFALDHYYARHIETATDTSEAKLRAYFDKDPERYAVNPHAIIRTMDAPTRAAADSLVDRLQSGTTWAALCAERYEEPRVRDTCDRPRGLADADRDTVLVADIRTLKPGGALVRTQMVSTGPSYMVYQLIDRVPHSLRSYEDSRTFVLRDLVRDQTEARLAEVLKGLKKKTPLVVNEQALASLELGPGTE